MKALKLWYRVGPPTRKRSGTIVFIAVLGVLLVGGTAMAANLGLFASAAPRDRVNRLNVRPPLSVTLPSDDAVAPTTATPTTEPQAGGDDRANAGVDSVDGESLEREDGDDGAGDESDQADLEATVPTRPGSGEVEDSEVETDDGQAADIGASRDSARADSSANRGQSRLEPPRWSGRSDGRLDDD